jgi:hypothetical protein
MMRRVAGANLFIVIAVATLGWLYALYWGASAIATWLFA